MFNSLRAVKLSTPITRLVLGSVIALVLALGLWLAMAPIAPRANIVLAAPNDAIEGLAASNDGPKVISAPISFTASITAGTSVTYTWHFGDGNDGDGITTTHAYAASGIYTASVVAVNNTDTETATMTVYVGDAVVTVKNFEFTPSDVTIPLGGSVVWVLLEGDHGVISNVGVTPSFQGPQGSDWDPYINTFNTAGAFPYHCIVHGTGMAGTVIVQAPTVPIEGLTAENDSPATINTPIEFTATITAGNNISYSWDFGDGAEASGLTEVSTTHAYTEGGAYTATVTAQNISSTTTATTTAYVGDAVVQVKNNSYSPATVSVPHGGTVVWVLAENTISHSVTADDLSFNQVAGLDWPPFVHTFPSVSVASTDAVSITYHDTQHPAMTGTVVLEAPAVAVAGLTAENDGPAQVLTPVHFTAAITSGDEPVTYTWDFGDGKTGTGITTTHTYTQSGSYTATVTANNVANDQEATTTVLVGDAIVDVSDFKFDPQTVTIPLGGTVIWVLRGGVHGVISDVGVTPSFQGPQGGSWDPYVHTFSTAGAFPYHCIVHGTAMPGTVIVSASSGQSEIRMPQLGKNP